MLKIKRFFLLACSMAFFAAGCAQTAGNNANTPSTVKKMDSLPNNPNASDTTPVVKTEEEWKKLLPADVYYVARLKGTERPWTSEYENSKEVGTYYCRACGNPLFLSDTKFESGCGWPSFYKPYAKNSIIYSPDHSHGMERTEVMCGRCKSHLGHVFDDGPPPTGLRYCINGVILDFKKAQAAQAEFEGKKKENNQ